MDGWDVLISGRLVSSVMASVSQWERETIGERTRDALSHKTANRERVGTVPFGFQISDDGMHLGENRWEQNIMARV